MNTNGKKEHLRTKMFEHIKQRQVSGDANINTVRGMNGEQQHWL